MTIQPLTPADWQRTADFIAVSPRHARSLTLDQRHAGADRTLAGLRNLARTIREQGATLGYMPEIIIGDMLAAIDAATADVPL